MSHCSDIAGLRYLVKDGPNRVLLCNYSSDKQDKLYDTIKNEIEYSFRKIRSVSSDSRQKEVFKFFLEPYIDNYMQNCGTKDVQHNIVNTYDKQKYELQKIKNLNKITNMFNTNKQENEKILMET